MTRRLRAHGIFVLAGSLAVLAPLGARADEKPDPVLAEMGQEYFQAYCASCHGLSAQGDGPVADSLKTRPANLTQIAARRGGTFPGGEIARFIDGRFEVPAHGTREMPIWGATLGANIPESEIAEEVVRGKIASLVEYLKTIQVQGEPANTGSQ